MTDKQRVRDELVDELSLIIAKARHGPGVMMDGAHNPKPSERIAAARFVDDYCVPLLRQNYLLLDVVGRVRDLLASAHESLSYTIVFRNLRAVLDVLDDSD